MESLADSVYQECVDATVRVIRDLIKNGKLAYHDEMRKCWVVNGVRILDSVIESAKAGGK